MTRFQARFLGFGPLVAGICALSLVLAAGVVAHADQTDDRLDGLFEALRTADTAGEARGIELQIWEIWLETDNAEAAAGVELGISAMSGGEYAAALVAFDQAVAAAPEFAEGWNKRATVLYLMGQFEQSLADVDRTLALEPRHFGALSGMGLIFIELGDEELALDAFERALEVHPKMIGPRRNADALRKRMQDREI